MLQNSASSDVDNEGKDGPIYPGLTLKRHLWSEALYAVHEAVYDTSLSDMMLNRVEVRNFIDSIEAQLDKAKQILQVLDT